MTDTTYPQERTALDKAVDRRRSLGVAAVRAGAFSRGVTTPKKNAP